MIRILNVQSLYSALYKTIDFCRANDKEIIEIIVPDKLSLFMEKFLFEHMHISASFNIKVSTLNRFAKRNCDVDKSSQISKVGSILLIHRILNENIERLKILKNKSYSFSYAEDIFQTIGQLKASKIGFEEMKTFMSKDERLSEKIQDLALVYEQYENLKAGLLDASDMFLMSTLSVSKGKENSKILFVGFDDFTAIEYSIIERLATVCEVNVVNYFSKENNKFLYNHEVVAQLKNIAYINQLPFELENCNVEKDSLKQYLESNLFAFNKNNYVLNSKVVKIFSGSNCVDEIEFVARDIRKRILEGSRYDDFGVAVFGLENHLVKVQEIFEKYELNYYIDSQMSINKSILFKFFLSILKYNLEGYDLSNLIDLINFPFFAVEREKKREIIQKLIALNFRGQIQDDFVLDIDKETLDCLIEFVSKIVFNKDMEVSSIIEKFKTFDLDFDLDNAINELAQNDVENKILLSKSKTAIFTLFDEILKFNPSISIEAFYDIFIHIANVVKINNLPLSLDAIKVVDANNSMEIFKEFYLINATQSNAPNLKYDCGIILDNEIEKLNFSHKLSPTISHINKLAKLRLFNSLLLFENELTVTYSNLPSDVIKELMDRLQVDTKKGVKNIVPILKFDFDKYIALSKWDFISSACEGGNENNFEIIKNTEKIIKNKDFSLKNSKNLEIFNDLRNISATALENYFKCPLLAFMNNVLKIKPRNETEILAFDIGNLLHEIMFKFYKSNKKVGDIYEFCKKEIFKAVEKDERLKLNVNSPILVNLIDEAVRVINAVNYIDENSDFSPQFFEFDFGGKNALELKNISIVGKVDRVDVFNDMFRIIDYKSGKADASLKELYYGNKLQLFLYSCAMENVLKKKAVGSFYLPLHNAYTRELANTYSLKGFYLAEDFVVRSFDKRLTAGLKSDIVNVKLNKNGEVSKMGGYKELNINELESLKVYSKVVSENAVNEIKSGYITPSPSAVSKSCEYCPYVHLCLKSSNLIKYRETKKINLDSFKEVRNEGV